MERHPRSTVNPSQLTVSIMDGIVVIAASGEFDLDATEALLRTVGAAVSTGETVMVDLDPGRSGDPERWPHPERHAEAVIAQPGPGATAIAPGYVRVPTGCETWTLDLARRRFCRSATPVDPRFVQAPSWTAIRATWITSDRITVLTVAGTYISAPASWAMGAGVVAA